MMKIALGLALAALVGVIATAAAPRRDPFPGPFHRYPAPLEQEVLGACAENRYSEAWCQCMLRFTEQTWSPTGFRTMSSMPQGQGMERDAEEACTRFVGRH